jgi:TadE-like protein
MAQTRTRFGNLFGRRSQSGSAAIEFAILGMFVLIALAGTAEVGQVAMEAMQVTNAVEAGTLWAAKHKDFDVGKISSAVGNATGALVVATPAPVLFCGCPNASGVSDTCDGSLHCADGSLGGQYVRVYGELGHQTNVLLLGLNIPATLKAQSIVRLN